MELDLEQIARICHETNRAYCASIGDHSQKPWEEAAQWQRDSAVEGVRFVLNNPQAPASANHDSWLDSKLKAGWKHGPVKDETAKTHPCFVPYDELPLEQRMKDYLFRSIVSAFVQCRDVEFFISTSR